MKFANFREIYKSQTEKASELTRTVSLGGIGAIWVIRPANAALPGELAASALSVASADLAFLPHIRIPVQNLGCIPTAG